MAQVLVRNLDDDVKTRLQQRARRHGRSMEEEIRDILRQALADDELTPSSSLWLPHRRPFRGQGVWTCDLPGAVRAASAAGRVGTMIILDTNVLSALIEISQIGEW